MIYLFGLNIHFNNTVNAIKDKERDFQKYVGNDINFKKPSIERVC